MRPARPDPCEIDQRGPRPHHPPPAGQAASAKKKAAGRRRRPSQISTLLLAHGELLIIRRPARNWQQPPAPREPPERLVAMHALAFALLGLRRPLHLSTIRPPGSYSPNAGDDRGNKALPPLECCWIEPRERVGTDDRDKDDVIKGALPRLVAD